MKYTPDDQRKHLEFLQLAISRMASNSFIIKGWTITLVAGLLFLAARSSSGFLPLYSIFAFIPAFAFWILDAYYLTQERSFRKVYDSVRLSKPEDVNPYSFKIKVTCKNFLSTLFSLTVILLHGSIISFISLYLIFMINL